MSGIGIGDVPRAARCYVSPRRGDHLPQQLHSLQDAYDYSSLVAHSCGLAVLVRCSQMPHALVAPACHHAIARVPLHDSAFCHNSAYLPYTSDASPDPEMHLAILVTWPHGHQLLTICSHARILRPPGASAQHVYTISYVALSLHTANTITCTTNSQLWA